MSPHKREKRGVFLMSFQTIEVRPLSMSIVPLRSLDVVIGPLMDELKFMYVTGEPMIEEIRKRYFVEIVE